MLLLLILKHHCTLKYIIFSNSGTLFKYQSITLKVDGLSKERDHDMREINEQNK